MASYVPQFVWNLEISWTVLVVLGLHFHFNSSNLWDLFDQLQAHVLREKPLVLEISGLEVVKAVHLLDTETFRRIVVLRWWRPCNTKGVWRADSITGLGEESEYTVVVELKRLLLVDSMSSNNVSGPLNKHTVTGITVLHYHAWSCDICLMIMMDLFL